MTTPSLQSAIRSVLVFRQGAEIRRVADTGSLSGKPSKVWIEGLPLCLEDATLQAQVHGDGPAPTATDVRVTLGVFAADPTLPPPDDQQLLDARYRVRTLEDQLAQIVSRRERLEQIPAVERPEGKEGEPPPQAPVKGRRELLAFRHERMEELDTRIRALHEDFRQADEQRKELQARKRSSARQTRPHELRKGAEVVLNWPEEEAATWTLEIRYRVPGARWAPTYTIAMESDYSAAQLSVRAVVAQHTGEDWSGVSLELSTAAADPWFDLPELNALRIGRRQAAPAARGWRPPPVGAGALYKEYDRFRRAAPAAPAPQGLVEERREEIYGEFAEAEEEEDAFDDDLQMDFAEPEMMACEVEEPMAGAEPEELMAVRCADEFAAGPPPPPAPMPASAPMPAQMVAPAPMSPSAMKAKKSMPQRSQAAPGGGAPPTTPPEPPPLEAAPDQLAYGDLRMPGPHDSGRGSLTAMSLRARYRELVVVRDLQLEFDVVEIVGQSVATARRAGDGGYPQRYHAPAPWDGFDAIYRAESAIEVASDGEYHAVPLLSDGTTLSARHVVVPRESTDVFRVAVLANPLTMPLLPGPAEIYVGGDYLLTGEVSATPPAGEVRVGLGVDPAVKVSRNTSYDEESAGLMGGSLALKHQIRIEVANRRSQAIQLEVRERIPHLRDKEDDIELKSFGVEPPWEAWEPKDGTLRGGHRWRVPVEAGQTRELVANYGIKIAAKHELLGGNRREV